RLVLVAAILHDERRDAHQVGDVGGADGTRWYYRTLAGIFREVLPGPLAERHARAVASFD
ncbi:MAG: phosphohydrolase, partial [Alphaproteobacteria bacterium]